MDIVEITEFGTADAPAPDLVAACDLWARWSSARLGHTDFQALPSEIAVRAADAGTRHTMWWVAREGSRVVGSLELVAPVRDNRHLAELEMLVDPAYAVEPVLDALWRVARERMRALGRPTAATWTLSSGDERGDLLRPASGSGALHRDAYAGWLLEHGFTLEQVDRAGVLRLPDGLPDLDALEGGAVAAGEAYEVITWAGATPDRFVEPLCHLLERMSVDAPRAGLDRRLEHWTPERVLSEDRAVAAMGRLVLWALAIVRSTGEPAAYTQVHCPLGRPQVAYQQDTFVLAAHRGHRLGLRVKVANLRQLMAAGPQVRRLRTWNADENRWMLAINEALGFRNESVEGSWQKRL